MTELINALGNSLFFILLIAGTFGSALIAAIIMNIGGSNGGNNAS